MRLYKIAFKKFQIVFFAAFACALLISGVREGFACDTTEYNFWVFFATQNVDSSGENYGPILDSLNKFATLASRAIRDDGGSGEIKLILRAPVFDETVIFDPAVKQAITSSIETELVSLFKNQQIHLCDSVETAVINKKLGFAAGSDLIIFTPEIMKKAYNENGIYAVIDLSFNKMTFTKNYQFDIKAASADRRDFSRSDKYDARIRYKITKCSDGNILWIDEVPGISEDILYY